jgi:hypothetical protein
MQQFDFGVGSIVKFKNKVYTEPYAPYYDLYKDHVFQIDKIGHPDEDEPIDNRHVLLKCLDNPSLLVAGYVHEDELEYSDL